MKKMSHLFINQLKFENISLKFLKKPASQHDQIIFKLLILLIIVAIKYSENVKDSELSTDTNLFTTMMSGTISPFTMHSQNINDLSDDGSKALDEVKTQLSNMIKDHQIDENEVIQLLIDSNTVFEITLQFLDEPDTPTLLQKSKLYALFEKHHKLSEDETSTDIALFNTELIHYAVSELIPEINAVLSKDALVITIDTPEFIISDTIY